MNAMGLIGLILGVLVIAGFVVLRRRRRAPSTLVEEPGRPRTVAELVQMRAAAAQVVRPASPVALAADGPGADELAPASPVSGIEPAAPARAVAVAEPAPATDDDAATPESPQPVAPIEADAGQASRDVASISPPWGRVPDGSLTLPTSAPPVPTSPPPVPPAVMARVVPRAAVPPVMLNVVPEPAEVDEPDEAPTPPTGAPAAPAVAAGPPADPLPPAAAETETETAASAPPAAETGEPAGEPAPAGPLEKPAAVDPTPSAATDPADELAGFADWADIDTDEDNAQVVPTTTSDTTPAFGLAIVPRVVPAGDPAASEQPTGRARSDAENRRPAGTAGPEDTASATPPTTTGPRSHPRLTPEQRAAVRAAAREAEQDAVDLSLLRTLGFADPNPRPGAATAVSLATPAAAEPEIEEIGEDAQPVRFRVVRREGVPVADAAVTLLDGRGREAGNSVADVEGQGVVLAPRSGGYVLVSSAPDHQPGAVALTVDGEPLDVEVLLVRSGSVAGVVRGRDTAPVAGAVVTLLQDGEVVETVHTGSTGRYRIGDLATGEYTLAVASSQHDPVAAIVRVPEQADVEHDVMLVQVSEPGGTPGGHLRNAVRLLNHRPRPTG